MRYYDLYHGVELQPDRESGKIVLSFNIEGHGYGAVLATGNAARRGEQALMSKMKQLTAQPLCQLLA